jgi:ABC-type transport system substrate-binding protein
MKYIIDVILPETKRVNQKSYSVKSVDVIDEHTAKFNMTNWNNKLLVAMCTNKGNAISPAAHKKMGMKELTKHPIGTGPFKFMKWEKDVVIRYERFDEYWQGKPYLDAIEYHIIADPLTQMASFLNGEHHIAGDLSPKDAKYIEKKGKFVISSIPGQTHCIHGDGGNADSPWSKLKVRQAMAHAVNARDIAENIGLGYWSVCINGSLAIDGSWLADAPVKGYPYDPQKAKKLLAEAGYPNGFDTTLLVKNTPQHLVDAMTAIQGQLHQVGIRAKLDLMDMGREHEVTIGGGWQNGIHHVPHSRRPEYAISESYSRIGYIFAPSVIRPEETWEMVQRALKEPDPEKCKQLMHDVYKLEIDKYASNHWLFAMPYIAAKSKKVHDDGFMKASNMWWPSWQAWLEK